MAIQTLSGQDVIQIDSRVLNDLADATAVQLSFPNDLANAKSSKNGNILYAFNETGKQCTVTVRVSVGSSDDKYLNSRLQEMKNDFSKFILLTGVFTKRVGDGTGKLNFVKYQCSGGIFKKQIDASTNAEGNTDQSVAVYEIIFGNGSRVIQ